MAPSVVLYEAPAVPLGTVAVVIVSAGTTASVAVADLLGSAMLIALTVTF